LIRLASIGFQLLNGGFHFTVLKVEERVDLAYTLCYILQNMGLEFKIFSAKAGYFAV
jgi:hypothetical protein